MCGGEILMTNLVSIKANFIEEAIYKVIGENREKDIDFVEKQNGYYIFKISDFDGERHHELETLIFPKHIDRQQIEEIVEKEIQSGTVFELLEDNFYKFIYQRSYKDKVNLITSDLYSMQLKWKALYCLKFLIDNQFFELLYNGRIPFLYDQSSGRRIFTSSRKLIIKDKLGNNRYFHIPFERIKRSRDKEYACDPIELEELMQFLGDDYNKIELSRFKYCGRDFANFTILKKK